MCTITDVYNNFSDEQKCIFNIKEYNRVKSVLHRIHILCEQREIYVTQFGIINWRIRKHLFNLSDREWNTEILSDEEFNNYMKKYLFQNK